MKKIIFLILFFLTNYIFSQQLLDSSTSSFNFILPGQLLCDAQNTSSGFITLDESRTLSVFSSEGKKKWEKNIERGQNTFVKILPNDFILIINKNGNQLQLLNPTGTELWKIIPDEPLSNSVLAGKDGRFFIKNNNSICCYGLNGIKKWTLLNNFSSDFELQELKDGSILAILDNNSDDKNTKAIRFSPFGEILEEINFSSRIKYLTNSTSGILINFYDETSGLISVKNNKLKNIWKIERKKTEKSNQNLYNDFFISSTNSDDIFYISENTDGLKIYSINPQNGSEKYNFEVKNIKNPDFFNLNSQGLLLTDSNNCVYCSLQGKILFSGVFPKLKNKKYVSNKLFTQNNCLILFGNDWNVNGFKISQNTKERKLKSDSSKENYNNFYNINPSLFNNNSLMQYLDEDITSSETLNLIKNGSYGAKERKIIQKILSGCTAYQNILFTKNSRTVLETTVFERDSSGLERMISIIPYFGTDSFIDFTAYLIKYETNRSILNAILMSVKENGYDPDGKILNNLYLLAKHTNTKDITVASEICDAVYSICRFMGKPAFNKQGKEIITTFIYPKYNVNIKDYARETLKKISELDL